MAASEGIAKRASIGVGFTDTSFIDNMERFNRLLKGSNEQISRFHDVLDRTDQSISEFDQHMNMFADRHGETMDRIRQHNNDTARSTERLKETSRRLADTYGDTKDKIVSDNDRMDQSERQRYQNAIDNEHKINESLSHTATAERRNADEMARNYAGLKSKMNSVGNTSSHLGSRMATANGRVARSFHGANNGIDQHIQSVRNAQSHDYRWLRTAQDMSGATLGLGAAFYKGAKDATTLQQSYIHAGNMAHYGGEKMSQVQHDINQQWRVGSNLSVKYGISQDQIAKGYQALVARGYTTNESLHTQKSLLQAAIASGDNYNDVVKDSTNVLDAYNMRSQNATTMTDNTRKVVNEMAYASDQTATNFAGLGIGMSYVAATAHTTHQSISETSSALGILSNKGMQASQAGVGLRKVLNSFLSVNKKGQQAQVMKQLGLSEQDFKTSSGHLKSLGSLMTLLNNKTKNMDSQERGAVFHRFFGATGQEAALNLASDTKGLSQLNDQVERSQTMGKNHQGYVALLSAHNMKSAQNQFNKFKQAWEAFTITSAREILPTFTQALRHADVYLAKLNNLSPRAKKWTIFGALAVAAIAPISYAIFGIQSAFHGVEITLLHVRRLFAKPISHEMTTSADKQAAEQKAAADIESGDNSRLNKLNGLNYIKDYRHSDARQFEMDRFPRLTNAMRQVTHFGGDYGPESALSIAGTMRKPSMIARLNPFNKSARFFTGRFLPGFRTRSIETGLNASHLLRGTAGDVALRAGGSLLGKVNIITGIATSLPLVEKGLKWIDHTRIGGKIFAPLNKSLIKGMNGPVKFINRSWKFIKRGALDAIKPIEHEWHKMFSGESKSSRANLRGLREFTHIATSVIGGLFRTITKVAGNILKYGGHAIAGVMKTLRGVGTLAGAVANIFTGHWKRAWYLFKHGANITLSGVWNTFSNVGKGIAATAGNVLNGVWTSVKHVARLIAPPFIHAWHAIKASGIQTWHDVADPMVSMYHTATRTVSNIKDAFINGFDDLKDHLESILSGISSDISNVENNIKHPVKSAENFIHSHANGGAITHDQMSLVDENGQESAYNPIKNTFRLLGNNGPQVLKLYAGEHVLDAQDTHRLLTNGLGRGITLPGYAHGTDSIHGLLHGYAMGTGRAGDISAEEASEPGWLQHLDSELANTAESFSPSNMLRIPHDARAALTANGLKGKISNGADVLGDLPDADFLKSAKLGKLTKLLSPGKGVADVSSNLQDLGKAINDPIGHLMSKVPILHSTKGFLHSLPKDFSKVWPKLKSSMAIGRKFMIKALNGPIKRGIGDLRHNIPKWRNEAGRTFRRLGHSIARFGRSALRTGGRIMRRGKRLLSRAGHGIARFSRGTWSRAKRLGRQLWAGTKHIAGRMWSTTRRTASRMWNSAKRTGKDIWSHAKRIASDVGRTARSLWNKTKSGASRTWSRVISGARRMASNIGRTTSRLFHEAVAKGRSAWSDIKSGASRAVSAAKGMLDGLMSFAHSVASRIGSMMSHIHMPHFALGGQIRRNTMALVGEHGPETAYNAHTGTVRMLGMNGPQITMLLAGESVLTNTQTNRLLHGGLGRGSHLPAYARGTNARLSGPASRSSVFRVTGAFHGKQALYNMRGFNKHAKSIWDDVSSHIIAGSHGVSREVTKTNSDLSDNTRDIFKDMSKKVGNLSDDLRDGLIQAAHDMAEGFGDKFKKLVDYAKEDMESVIDKLNRGVTGIDSALRAFGGNSHVIHPIHYATGTMNGRIAYNQLGILNDAISGPRQEAILRGGNVLFPQGDNVPVPLQKGDAVLNGDQTKQLINNTTNINHYAKGSGFHFNNKLVSGITKTLGLALKGPKKFFTTSFDHLFGGATGHQLVKGISTLATNAINPLGIKWTKAIFSYIKNLINPTDPTSTSKIVNYANKYWTGVPYVFGGISHSGADCGGAVMTILHHFGIDVPHVNIEDSPAVKYVGKSASEAQPGDLVGFGSKSGAKSGASSHIGIFEKPGKMWSEHPPKSGQESINEAAAADGLWGYYRIKGVQNQVKPKKISALTRLVASELGPTAISWLKHIGSFMDSFNGGGTLAKGNGAISTAWNEFTKLGMTPTQIMGALGGAKQESGFSPVAHDPDGGLGMFQATPPYGNLRAYAAEHHEDWKDPAVQAKQYYEHWLKPSGYLGTHGSVYDEALYAARVESSSSIHGALSYDSDFGNRLAGARYIQRWYESHKHANGGWANSPAIFGEAGPEVAINPRRDTADRYIVEAINARMHHNENSPMANLVRSIGVRHQSGNLRDEVTGLLSHAANSAPSNHKKSVNINISFGNIVVNSNGGNLNTGALANKVRRTVKQAIQRAAYESATKLD